MEQGSYERGEKTGSWTTWQRTGERVEEEYVLGLVVKRRLYDASGELVDEVPARTEPAR